MKPKNPSFVKLVVLLLSITAHLSAYADKKEDLLNAALSKGPAPDGSYCITNPEGKNVRYLDMRKYVANKGFYALDGEGVQKYPLNSKIAKLYIVKPEDFYNYLYYTFAGKKAPNKPNKGTVYVLQSRKGGIGTDKTTWLGDPQEIQWHGNVVNGFINGTGSGLIIDKNERTSTYMEGTFENGFPVSDVILKKTEVSTDYNDWVTVEKKAIKTEKFETIDAYFIHQSTYFASKNMQPVLQKRLEELYKRDVARLDKVRQTISAVTKSNYMNVTKDDFVEEFRRCYTIAGYDPQKYLPIAYEILDAYSILNCMRLDINREYKRTLLHYENLDTDVEFFDKVMTKIKKWQSEGKSGFGSFYTLAHSVLDGRQKEVNKRHDVLEQKRKLAKKEKEAYNSIPIPQYKARELKNSDPIDKTEVGEWYVTFPGGESTIITFHMNYKDNKQYYRHNEDLYTYETFEDAVAAAWVRIKYRETRTKGRGFTRIH